MKKLVLALGLLLLPSLAWAQNPTCPTRPLNDSTNACANTIFVQNQIASELPTTPIVLLMTGQSNAVQNPAFSWTPNPNCKIWNWDGVDTHVGTAFVAVPTTTITVSNRWCSRIADLNPGHPVYLINISIASQPIAQWMVGAGSPDMFQNILNNIVPALALISVTKIDALGWWQGEANALASTTTYASNRETVDTRFRTQSWFPVNTPVVSFGISSAAQSSVAWSDNINGALKYYTSNASDVRKFVYPNTFTGATYWTDAFHMTGTGYDVVGVMAGNEFMRGVGRSALLNIVVDETTGNVGIGTGAIYPKVPLEVSVNASNVPSFAVGNSNIVGAFVGADSVLGSGFLLDSYSGTIGAQVGSYMFYRAANGSGATPSALAANSQVGGQRFYGFDGAAYQQTAAFLVTANENYSGGHFGSVLDFYATSAGGAITRSLTLTGFGAIARASDTIPAGGSSGFGYSASSTSNFGTFFGSGAPTLSAAQGSIYLRSDGTAPYVNTNGSTGWGQLATTTASVASFSAGTTGFTPNTATTGAVTLSGTLVVANGGTNCAVASVTCFNNITGFTASGTTGTTSTNLVFSASPTFTGTLTAATVTASNIISTTLGGSNALFVNSNLAGNSGLQLTNTNAGGNASILFSTDTATMGGFFALGSGSSGYAGANSVNVGAISNFPVGLFSNNTLRIYISAAGGVFVGSSTTDAGVGNLQVNGTVRGNTGFSANGTAGVSTVCTETVGNTLTFTFGLLTTKGANCT